jgi:two-component sensor histidine kinase
VATRYTIALESAALSLALAVVEASRDPLLLLDGELTIVEASASFLSGFDLRRDGVRGFCLSNLGAGEWAGPGLRSLLTAALAGERDGAGCEMTLQRAGRDPRDLVVHAKRLDYLDVDNPRLLVEVSDVTEAHADRGAWAEAVRQSAVLLQEVRHRVANSLQIIATVLLDHARQTHSEETRRYLQDAHNRVLSIAALEHRLSRSRRGKVDVRIYFTELFDNIGASLIGERDRVDLIVSGPGGVVDAQESIGLGLIVTELVINALKHAFPDGRRGRVTVECAFRGPNWTLVVSDNGVGSRKGGRDLAAGLGATIVRALARDLHATVEFETTLDGARVTVSRRTIALVDMSYKSAPSHEGQFGGAPMRG